MKSNSEVKQPSKRNLIDLLLGGGIFLWILGMIWPLLRYLMPPKTTEVALKAVSLGQKSAFPNDGVRFKFGSQPGIAIKMDGGQILAFNSKCTHLGCNVDYIPDKKIFFCNCHGGKYDSNGKNIGGPPPKPLVAFNVTERKGEILVSEGKAT